ncbi:MAG: hypothetical protein IPI67_16580 [Myxococcales bacterium]|nr:hypothetical protein [Myxococcales bacterium]
MGRVAFVRDATDLPAPPALVAPYFMPLRGAPSEPEVQCTACGAGPG